MTDNPSPNTNIQSVPENSAVQVSAADINADNVPHFPTKLKSTKSSYTETDLQNAIRQALTSAMSIGKIAAQYRIPRSTLFDRVQKEILKKKSKTAKIERKRMRKMQLDFAIRAFLTRNETIEKIAEEFKISSQRLRKKVYKTEDDTESEELSDSDNELDNNWANKFLEVQMTEQCSTPYVATTPASDPQDPSPTPVMNPFAIHKPLKKRFEFTPVLRKITEMSPPKHNSRPSKSVAETVAPATESPAMLALTTLHSPLSDGGSAISKVTLSPVSSHRSLTPSSPTQSTGNGAEPRPKKYLYRLKSRAAGATYCYFSSTPITLIKPIIRLDKLGEKEIAELIRRMRGDAETTKKETPAAKRRKTEENRCLRSGCDSEVLVERLRWQRKKPANSTNVKVVLERLDAAMLPGGYADAKPDVSRLETECNSVIADSAVAVKEEPRSNTYRDVPPVHSVPERKATKERSLRDDSVEFLSQLNILPNGGPTKESENVMRTRKKRLKFLPDGTLVLPRSRMERNFSPERIHVRRSRKHRAKSKSSGTESNQGSKATSVKSESASEAPFSADEDVASATMTTALNESSSNGSSSHSVSIVKDSITINQKRNTQPEKERVPVPARGSASPNIENDLSVRTSQAKKTSNRKNNTKAALPNYKVKEVLELTLSRKNNNVVKSSARDSEEHSISPPVTPPLAVRKLNAAKTVEGIVNPAQILSCLLRVPVLPDQLNVVRFRPKFSETNTVNHVNITPSKLKADNNVIKPITKRQLELLKSTPFKIVPKSQIQAVLHDPVKEEPLDNGLV